LFSERWIVVVNVSYVYLDMTLKERKEAYMDRTYNVMILKLLEQRQNERKNNVVCNL